MNYLPLIIFTLDALLDLIKAQIDLLSRVLFYKLAAGVISYSVSLSLEHILPDSIS